MANIKIYIPTFISDQSFTPARVNPRVFFYNGRVDCEPFLIETIESSSAVQYSVPSFPYFDHYSAESGGYEPGLSSNSLLFLNEGVAYGTVPTSSLYDGYWETYINLLYEPTTRLLDAQANIPLPDYNEMELNDIVEFRGNYYHLRAINDYNIATGECQIQLLGPVIPGSVKVENSCTQSIDMGSLVNYICSGSTFAITDVTASDGYESISWSGLGTFNTSSIINPIFTPSNLAIENGSANIQMNIVYSNDCVYTLDKPLQIVTPIGGTTSPLTQSIDYATIPTEISVTGSYISSGSNPILPVTGSTTFQWYDSTDNVTYNLIPNATGSTYQGGTAFVDKWYRREVEYVDLGCVATSSAAFVDVLPDCGFDFTFEATTAPVYREYRFQINRADCPDVTIDYTCATTGESVSYFVTRSQFDAGDNIWFTSTTIPVGTPAGTVPGEPPYYRLNAESSDLPLPSVLDLDLSVSQSFNVTNVYGDAYQYGYYDATTCEWSCVLIDSTPTTLSIISGSLVKPFGTPENNFSATTQSNCV